MPKDSKIRMVDRIVRSMDINPLMDTYDGIGAPPYSPKMLLSLVVFAYINGIPKIPSCFWVHSGRT